MCESAALEADLNSSFGLLPAAPESFSSWFADLTCANAHERSFIGSHIAEQEPSQCGGVNSIVQFHGQAAPYGRAPEVVNSQQS